MLKNLLAVAVIALTSLVVAASGPAMAESVVKGGPGWTVLQTTKTYPALLEDLRAAIKANKMGLVTDAGPTEVAAKRGETIPGNRVLGVFRNDFAVSIIRAAPAAMIEAPIRFMVMEEPNGTATLAWIAPSTVFAPYAVEGGDVLSNASNQLDQIFATIAADAVK